MQRTRETYEQTPTCGPDPQFASVSTPKTTAATEAQGKKGHFYKPLLKEFRRHGFYFRQICREGDVAIFEQTWLGSSEPSVCYELIIICRREGFQIGDRFIEPAEVYPNSEAWGIDGFTVTDRDGGFAKLRQLYCSSSDPSQKEPS